MEILTPDRVRDAVIRFAATYSAKDLDALLGLISSDDNVIVIGSGADEVRIGADAVRAQYQRDLTEADELHLDVGSTRATIRGEVAWAYVEPILTATVGGQQVTMPLRMTVVLVAEREDVLIHHVHISVAFSEQQPGRSFPSP